MQCENDQIDVDFEPDQSPAEANDVTGKSLAETNNLVIAAVARNGTDSMNPATTATTPKGGALAAPTRAVVEDEVEEEDKTGYRYLSEDDEKELEEKDQIPMFMLEMAKDGLPPACHAAESGKSPCEDRRCESHGTRKRDGRPCAKKNCYCRCVVMSTGGRFCDEWVAEGCRDNDGCFRARDFQYLTTVSDFALDWRVKHPDVVFAAMSQLHPENIKWRNEVEIYGNGSSIKTTYEDFIKNVMLKGRELEAMRALARTRMDLPMLNMVGSMEKIVKHMEKGLELEAIARMLF